MTMFRFQFGFDKISGTSPSTLPFCIDTDGEEIARKAHDAFKEAMWEAFKLSRAGSDKDVSMSWGVLKEGEINQIGLDPMVKDDISALVFDFSKIDMYRISDLTV